MAMAATDGSDLASRDSELLDERSASELQLLASSSSPPPVGTNLNLCSHS